MSGNVHPNPGPFYPCSVCAGNMTSREKSVQCCTCSKWVHQRYSLLSLSKLRTLGSSHSWSCPPPPAVSLLLSGLIRFQHWISSRESCAHACIFYFLLLFYDQCLLCNYCIISFVCLIFLLYFLAFSVFFDFSTVC